MPRREVTNRRALWGALLVFCFSAALMAFFFFRWQAIRETDAQMQARILSRACAATFQQSCDEVSRSLRMLALLIKEFHQNEGRNCGQQEHGAWFEAAVRDMMSLYPNLLAATQSMDCGDRIYPSRIEAPHRRLLEEICRRPADGSSSVVEIVSVSDGTEPLMIGRASVPPDKKSGRRVAGSVCMLFRLPELPFPSATGPEAYAWELWSLHSKTGRKQRLAASATPLRGTPQEYPVSLSGTTWMISVTPPRYETPLPPLFAAGTILCVLLSLGSGWLLHLMEKKKYLERIYCTDPLTCLPNRRLLLQTLEQMISRKPEAERAVAVCYVDLDDFKSINDTLGHKSGDLLLAEFAGRLSSALDCGEIAARIGGDEFVLLLRVRGQEDCRRRLDALLSRLRAPFRLETEARALRTSIGVALWPEHGASVDALLRRADQAMYRAKTTGGEGICFSPQHTGC